MARSTKQVCLMGSIVENRLHLALCKLADPRDLKRPAPSRPRAAFQVLVSRIRSPVDAARLRGRTRRYFVAGSGLGPCPRRQEPVGGQPWAPGVSVNVCGGAAALVPSAGESLSLSQVNDPGSEHVANGGRSVLMRVVRAKA
ncbi:uncharacterized protein LOC143663394 [Tamandua tetradactyla]|uniref:uncharacterized protein LOC143663394 n=1 Tax=Tamandua tetradactyla TaxID=48850 RepID=UPI0040547648